MLGRSPCCSLVLSYSLCSGAWSHRHLSIAHTASETLIQPFSQVQMCLKFVHMQLHIQRQAYTELLCPVDDKPMRTHHWAHSCHLGTSTTSRTECAPLQSANIIGSSFLLMHLVKSWQRCRQKARQTAIGLAACAHFPTLSINLLPISCLFSQAFLHCWVGRTAQLHLLALAGHPLLTCLVGNRSSCPTKDFLCVQPLLEQRVSAGE